MEAAKDALICPTLDRFSCDDIIAVGYRGLEDDLRRKVRSSSGEIERKMQRIKELSLLLTKKNQLDGRAELFELSQQGIMALQPFLFCNLKGWKLTLLPKYDDNPCYQKPEAGLHLIGTCKTINCPLKGQKAWSFWGWGIALLSKTDLCKEYDVCSGGCKQPLSAVHSLALHACHFQFNGRSPETGVPRELEKGRVSANEIMICKGEPAEWNHLQVVVSPLEG